MPIPGFGRVKLTLVPLAAGDKWLVMPHADNSLDRIPGLSAFFVTLGDAMVYGHQIATKIANGDL